MIVLEDFTTKRPFMTMIRCIRCHDDLRPLQAVSTHQTAREAVHVCWSHVAGPKAKRLPLPTATQQVNPRYREIPLPCLLAYHVRYSQRRCRAESMHESELAAHWLHAWSQGREVVQYSDRGPIPDGRLAERDRSRS